MLTPLQAREGGRCRHRLRHPLQARARRAHVEVRAAKAGCALFFFL
jgi:hypothetical protein